MAGAGEPVARLLRELLARESRGGASVLGTTRATSAATAALLNGPAGQALDYDDMATPMPDHPTIPILPGLVALAECRGRSSGGSRAPRRRPRLKPPHDH